MGSGGKQTREYEEMEVEIDGDDGLLYIRWDFFRSREELIGGNYELGGRNRMKWISFRGFLGLFMELFG